MTKTDYNTIRADAEAVAKAREAKRDGETWSDYLLRCADADPPRKWTEEEIESLIESYIDSLRAGQR